MSDKNNQQASQVVSKVDPKMHGVSNMNRNIANTRNTPCPSKKSIILPNRFSKYVNCPVFTEYLTPCAPVLGVQGYPTANNLMSGEMFYPSSKFVGGNRLICSKGRSVTSPDLMAKHKSRNSDDGSKNSSNPTGRRHLENNKADSNRVDTSSSDAKADLHSILMHLKSIELEAPKSSKQHTPEHNPRVANLSRAPISAKAVDSTPGDVDAVQATNDTHSGSNRCELGPSSPIPTNVAENRTYVDTPKNSVKTGHRRRAVVVGCSYIGSGDISLRGSCNDALLFASVLVRFMGFDTDDIILLIDTEPADAYTSQLSRLTSSQSPKLPTPKNVQGTFFSKFFGVFNAASKLEDEEFLDLPDTMTLDSPGPLRPESSRPTRANILKALRWLTNGTKPGDCSLFYYSGHSVQIDDLSGWEGEGFDEALVPTDYMDYGDPGNGVIPAIQIRRMLQIVDKCCQVTMILDTTGLQTALDPAGCSGSWGYIRGAKLRGFWPLADATGKIRKANYNADVWKDMSMQTQLVRPRFVPSLDVDCVSSLTDPFLATNHSSSSANAICIAAAPWESVALEALFKPIILSNSHGTSKITSDSVVCHGVFTYCLVLTLLYDRPTERLHGLTIREITSGINKRIAYLKRKRLSKLDQNAEATIHPSALASLSDLFAVPWGGVINTHQNKNLQCKSLEMGADSFLHLSDAWMQLHTEGRMKAAEQKKKFCRMRNAAVNIDSRYNTSQIGACSYTNLTPCPRNYTGLSQKNMVYSPNMSKQYYPNGVIDTDNWYAQSLCRTPPRTHINPNRSNTNLGAYDRGTLGFPSKAYDDMRLLEPITTTLLSRLPTARYT